MDHVEEKRKMGIPGRLQSYSQRLRLAGNRLGLPSAYERVWPPATYAGVYAGLVLGILAPTDVSHAVNFASRSLAFSGNSPARFRSSE